MPPTSTLEAALSAAADRDQQRLEWFHCLGHFARLESLRPEAVLRDFFAHVRPRTRKKEPLHVPTVWPELLDTDSPVRDAIRRVIRERVETTLPGFDAETSAGTRPLLFHTHTHTHTNTHIDCSRSRWLSASTRYNGRVHVRTFFLLFDFDLF